ncbi:hypothetical protein AGLY_003450 [Aphis glycines]|uniref:Uncharacterized protein n=1 Tax=Aphis glycines TaxID=307491 RepID=A0A6G0U061_APHGL|nr:hypothetical protein AGLY_003450 [Aphis glycines]
MLSVNTDSKLGAYILLYSPFASVSLLLLVDPTCLISQIRDDIQQYLLVLHVDYVVQSFLKQAHQKTAHFVSTAKVDEYAEHVKSKTESNDTTVVSLKMNLVYRISRKISKLVFGMFATEERKAHNLEATINAYVLHVSNRTTRVNYNKRHYKPREQVDTKSFIEKYKNVEKSLRNQYQALYF